MHLYSAFRSEDTEVLTFYCRVGTYCDIFENIKNIRYFWCFRYISGIYFLQDICYKSDKIALITLLLYNYSTTLSKRKIYGALEINKVIKLPITLEFAATLQISNSKIPNYLKLHAVNTSRKICRKNLYFNCKLSL